MLEKIPVMTAAKRWSVLGNRSAKSAGNHWKTRGGSIVRTVRGNSTIFPRGKRFLYIREKSVSPCTVLNIVIRGNMPHIMQKKPHVYMAAGSEENRLKRSCRFRCTAGRKKAEDTIRRRCLPWRWEKDVERKANLKKAFQLVPDIVKYKKILIVDDIYTTGSTIDAVAEVLLQAGVEEIYFLCISIGEGF